MIKYSIKNCIDIFMYDNNPPDDFESNCEQLMTNIFKNNFLIKNVISAIFKKALNNKRKIEPFSKAKIAAITSLLRLVMIDFERWYSEYDALAKTKQIFIKNQELQKRNQQLESIVSSRSVQIWLKINKALRK